MEDKGLLLMTRTAEWCRFPPPDGKSKFWFGASLASSTVLLRSVGGGGRHFKRWGGLTNRTVGGQYRSRLETLVARTTENATCSAPREISALAALPERSTT